MKYGVLVWFFSGGKKSKILHLGFLLQALRIVKFVLLLNFVDVNLRG